MLPGWHTFYPLTVSGSEEREKKTEKFRTDWLRTKPIWENHILQTICFSRNVQLVLIALLDKVLVCGTVTSKLELLQ
jgi:hypothetical protein